MVKTRTPQRAFTRKQLLIGGRSGFALLVAAAISVQLSQGMLATSFSPVNFFSFFTIEANLLAAATFLLSACDLYAKRKPNPQTDSLRGAATLYMVVTGIVYSLLLTGVEVQTPLPWVNVILHYIFPLVVLADWLLEPPRRRQFSARQWLPWLIFPLIYATYSLIRGPFAHDWYPYPFLNIAHHGYTIVALNCALIAFAITLLAKIIATLPRLLDRKR